MLVGFITVMLYRLMRKKQTRFLRTPRFYLLFLMWIIDFIAVITTIFNFSTVIPFLGPSTIFSRTLTSLAQAFIIYILFKKATKPLQHRHMWDRIVKLFILLVILMDVSLMLYNEARMINLKKLLKTKDANQKCEDKDCKHMIEKYAICVSEFYVVNAAVHLVFQIVFVYLACIIQKTNEEKFAKDAIAYGYTIEDFLPQKK